LAVQRGVSLIELMIVVAILFIIAVIGIPQMLKAMHLSQVRSAANGVSGLVQQARILAERQNTTLGVYTGAVDKGVTGAFVDNTGNGSTWHTGDSYVDYGSNVTNGASASAPSGLSPGFTPEAAGTTLYFNSLGMAVKSGGVSSKGVVFYFTDAYGDWGAVAVSSLGRSKVWIWNGGGWQ
jgi:prepilin-type N-terminal cleavage/methylation domain-containing protein